jgi:hypothetical protein
MDCYAYSAQLSRATNTATGAPSRHTWSGWPPES